MGRALILLVDENGVEYLPTLQTHSLDGVQVPESVVKEWRRRKGLGTTSSSAAATATTSAGQGQNAKAVASATRNGETGRHAPPATPHDVPGLSRCLQRIRKMVPLDERGIWLLNHLLSQVRVGERVFLVAGTCPCGVEFCEYAVQNVVEEMLDTRRLFLSCNMGQPYFVVQRKPPL